MCQNEYLWSKGLKSRNWFLSDWPELILISDLFNGPDCVLFFNLSFKNETFVRGSNPILRKHIQDWIIFLYFFLLTRYQKTNFRLFQTERVCRQQFQIWRKWQQVIQMGRIHWVKRRNCSLRAISPFPTVFSTSFFPRGVKRRHFVGRVKRTAWNL